MTIRFIQRKDIDAAKWDACISGAKAPIYNQVAYLDQMSSNWDALVAGDYEGVMPLPWRQKWGVYYIYPPAFTQQLGISSSKVANQAICDHYLKMIPPKFKSIEINGQTSNEFRSHVMRMRMNHILSLQAPYPLLLEGYSRSAKRNIRKALDNGITIREDIHPAEVIEMHRNRFKDEVGYTSEDYARFTKLSESYYQAGKCICVGASMADKMIASGIFLKDDHRIYFVMNGNKEENLETGAAHLLIDHIIRKYAGSEMILDFEGSDHESFARFYKQYGAVQEPYPFLCIDRLPFLIQMVRRLRIFFSGKQ